MLGVRHTLSPLVIGPTSTSCSVRGRWNRVEKSDRTNNDEENRRIAQQDLREVSGKGESIVSQALQSFSLGSVTGQTRAWPAYTSIPSPTIQMPRPQPAQALTSPKVSFVLKLAVGSRLATRPNGHRAPPTQTSAYAELIANYGPLGHGVYVCDTLRSACGTCEPSLCWQGFFHGSAGKYIIGEVVPVHTYPDISWSTRAWPSI